MNEHKHNHPIELLKQTPTELGVDQMEEMISAFPILPPPTDWSNFINLNSILMTGIGAIIIASSIGFFASNSTASTTEIRQYQLEQSQEKSTQDNALSFVEDTPNESPTTENVGNEAHEPPVDPRPENAVPEATPVLGPDLKDPAEIPPTMTPREIPPMPATMEIEDGKRTFNLSGFTGVKLAGAHNVIVESGPFSVTATGDDKRLDKLEIEVRGNSLHVSSKNEKWNWNDMKGRESVVIRVSLPALSRLALAGSGNLDVGSFDDISELEVHLSGSGNLTVKGGLNVNGNIDIHLAGSGDIDLKGEAKSADISLAGSGDISARDMHVDIAEVSIAGSGDVSIHCSTELDVNIAGSGDVDYYGSPSLKQSVRGSGDVQGH